MREGEEGDDDQGNCSSLRVNMLCIFLQFFKEILSEFSVILYIPMIALEKSHQNISDYNQFLSK